MTAEGEPLESHREYADKSMGVSNNTLGQKCFAVLQGITFGVFMMATALVGTV